MKLQKVKKINTSILRKQCFYLIGLQFFFAFLWIKIIFLKYSLNYAPQLSLNRDQTNNVGKIIFIFIIIIHMFGYYAPLPEIYKIENQIENSRVHFFQESHILSYKGITSERVIKFHLSTVAVNLQSVTRNYTALYIIVIVLRIPICEGLKQLVQLH